MTEEKKQILRDEGPPMEKQSCFLRFITIYARLWALVTLAVLWAAAVVTIREEYPHGDYQHVAWYLLGASILMTFLELTWVLNKSPCCSRDGCCYACWRVVMWLDNWKKGILYLLMSIPLFLEGMRIILGIVSAFMLIIGGLLYILKTFRILSQSELSERTIIRTYSPSVRLVTHEISTQTEMSEMKYYTEEREDYLK